MALLGAAAFLALPLGGSAQASRIAIPSYFYPDCGWNSSCLWKRVDASAPTVSLAIINPDSGPGTAINPDYTSQRLASQSAGITIIGYVATGYGARTTSEVEAEIDRYYQWYAVDGIFLDEVPSDDCSAQAYYQDFNNYIKAKGGAALTVLNPGTTTEECFMSAGDIIVTFEDTYAEYLRWSPAGWESAYPAARFWHIVHTTSTQARMLNAVRLSKARNAGWIYVTPDREPNPYDTLPANAYWSSELGAVP
jgi:hypothetical protein